MQREIERLRAENATLERSCKTLTDGVAALETLLAEWQEDYALEHSRAKKWRRKYKRLAQTDIPGDKTADDVMPCGCGAGSYCTNKYNAEDKTYEVIRVCFKCGRFITLDGGDTITDGHGNVWPRTCHKCGGKMQVVRPGYARCGECEE
jgi:hypothetical protein